MRRTTISLPEDLAQRLDDESGRRGLSRAELIRETLEREFCRPAGRRLRIEGIVSDPNPPFARDHKELTNETWADDILRDRG